MKIFSIVTATAVSLAAFSGGSGAGAQDPIFRNATLDQQVNFKSWRLDKDNKGHQIVAPLSVKGSADLNDELLLDLGVRTAWISAENDSLGGEGKVSHLSDTILSMVATYTGWSSFRPFIALDLNLPTGKTKLRGAEKNAVMDPDLVQVIRFGEGFNSNLSAGVTWNETGSAWSVVAALGRNWRGVYVADGDTMESFDPGDQSTALVRVQYLTKQLYAAFSAVYVEETETTLAGFDYFQPGESWEFGIEATYAFDAVSSISGSFLYQTSGKNSYLDFFTNNLIKENVNSNGPYYFAQAAYSHQLDADWGLTFAATYGVRTDNSYLAAQALFIPERQYWDVRASADYKIDDNAKLSFDIGVGQVHDEATPFNAAQTYDTISAGIALSIAL